MDNLLKHIINTEDENTLLQIIPSISIEHIKNDFNNIQPLLHKICIMGYTECFIKLLDLVKLLDICYLEKKDKFHNTPLHYACIYNNYEIARILSENISQNGFKIQNALGDIPLHTCNNLKCYYIVENNITEYDGIYNVANYNNECIIHKWYLTPKIINKLIHITPIEMVLNIVENSTLLHWITNRPELIKIIIDKLPISMNNLISFKDYDDRTPLHYACINNQLQSVKYLLDRMSFNDICSRDINGNTALELTYDKDIQKLIDNKFKFLRKYNLYNDINYCYFQLKNKSFLYPMTLLCGILDIIIENINNISLDLKDDKLVISLGIITFIEKLNYNYIIDYSNNYIIYDKKINLILVNNS